MPRVQYDITIIGGGSGGLSAARIATSLGARVLLIDKRSLGGDCLRYGCVPSKSLLYAARLARQGQEAMRLGVALTHPQVDMAKVAAYVQDVIQRVQETEKVYTNDVSVKFGKAEFQSPTELLLDGHLVSCRNFVLATGSRPYIPEIEGLQTCGYLTNEQVFDLTALPKSLLIVGGGPVGVEMAQALARLGTQITLIQRSEQLLPKEDPEVAATLRKALEQEGIKIICGAEVTRVEKKNGQKTIYAWEDQQLHSFTADEILLAAGRAPDIEGLNLEAAGVRFHPNGIEVNEYLQTSTPRILALGDAIGGYQFSHVAAFQAKTAVRNALLPLGKKKMEHTIIPWCTFTDPEVAHAGLTASQAQQQYKLVHVMTLPWSEIDRAQTENATCGFIKLVLVEKREEIVGAHMIGAGAGELLGEMTLAIQHHMTISDIYNTIHAYPTMSTGLQQAAFEAYLKGEAAANNRRIVSTVLKLRG